MEQVEKKDWRSSWTIWFNVAVVAGGILVEVLNLFPGAAKVSVILAGIVNIALRFKTQQGIK